MPPKFAFDNPTDATMAIAEKLATVSVCTESYQGFAHQRVLAEDVLADRNSPAADVSAMDGYAIRMDDLKPDTEVPVRGESSAGSPPPAMETGGVVRIFTGAIVPAEAEAVIKREDTVESGDTIQFLPAALSTAEGEHIRRSGENIQAGAKVIESGTLITAARQAAMTNFGVDRPAVYRPVRVSIVTTGDEVGLFQDSAPQPWQLRNSNQASLASCLSGRAWINIVRTDHAVDDREATKQTLLACLEESDAVLLTGGVSMGDYDYVPDVVREIGGDVVFHGLPVRPGKPILGAATDQGKLILGLPGNPVSATIGCRRMALPLLAKISGQSNWLPMQSLVQLKEAGDKTIPLHWMRLVNLTGHGIAEPVQSRGSGDLVSLGRSSGFVELPPGKSGDGPWPYYPW